MAGKYTGVKITQKPEGLKMLLDLGSRECQYEILWRVDSEKLTVLYVSGPP